MGTSTNRLGPKPNIPLLPDWLNEYPEEENNIDETDIANQNQDETTEDKENSVSESEHENQPLNNRFNSSQRGFRKAVQTGEYSGLQRVLKTYISRASGGSSTSARRMSRSSKAIATFGNILTNIRENGLSSTLERLNLADYANRPAIEVLSALMEEICGASALLDDAITRHAYAITVIRVVSDIPNLDLTSLTEGQVYEMMAIFLEESIVYRLICDVGRSQTVATSDPVRAIEIEDELYQIINGLVHSKIIPELRNSLGDQSFLSHEIQRVYQIAFQTILDS